MSKKTRNIIIIGIFVCFLGGAGGYGGLYYNAVKGIEVEIDTIYITDYDISGTLLSPSLDIDLEIHASISNPSFIPINIQCVQFDLYLDGDYLGNGETDAFRATKVPSALEIFTTLEDVTGELYLEMLDLIIVGNSKTITILITAVQVTAFVLDLNQEIDVIVEQEDIL